MASSSKLEFARCSTLLRIQDRAKGSKGKELHGGWWGHRKEKTYILGGGDTAHNLLMSGTIGVGHRTYFVNGGTIGVGTPHN